MEGKSFRATPSHPSKPRPTFSVSSFSVSSSFVVEPSSFMHFWVFHFPFLRPGHILRAGEGASEARVACVALPSLPPFLPSFLLSPPPRARWVESITAETRSPLSPLTYCTPARPPPARTRPRPQLLRFTDAEVPPRIKKQSARFDETETRLEQRGRSHQGWKRAPARGEEISEIAAQRELTAPPGPAPRPIRPR